MMVHPESLSWVQLNMLDIDLIIDYHIIKFPYKLLMSVPLRLLLECMTLKHLQEFR